MKNIMKDFIPGITVIGFIITIVLFILTTPVDANVNIKVFSEEIVVNNPPFIQNGRTYLPLRDLAEAMDFEVVWDGVYQTVYFSGVQTDVRIHTFHNIVVTVFADYTLNFIAYDYPAIINKNDRIYVAVRVLDVLQQCEIIWDDSTKTVDIYNAFDYADVTEKKKVDEMIYHFIKDENIYKTYFVGDDMTDESGFMQYIENTRELVSKDANGFWDGASECATELRAAEMELQFDIIAGRRNADGSLVNNTPKENAFKAGDKVNFNHSFYVTGVVVSVIDSENVVVAWNFDPFAYECNSDKYFYNLSRFSGVTDGVTSSIASSKLGKSYR